MGIKKAEFDGNFESFEKVAKKLMWKNLSTKQWQKNGDFDFYYCAQWFSSYTVAFYALFFTDSNSAPNFALYRIFAYFSTFS
jgi:hypothetical protein